VFDIPTVGRIAILEDPTGAIIGWMKPIPRG
jgi:predicted enzyme related to lactoylglutathione lyase